MTAKGTVVEIVFCNKENGYTVLNLNTTDGDIITVVGHLPSLAIGETLEVEGQAVSHNKYGEQLVVQSYVVSNPTSKFGIVRYLSSGLIKGIGEATALKIYNEFGNDTLNVIESNPSTLSKVKGISKKKALDISNSIAELKTMQTQIMFLQQYDISTNLALKIYNIYKQSTKGVVSQNPYKLIDDIDGVGFSTADKIALSMGLDPMGRFRLRAAVVFCLRETATKEGNTYLTVADLCSRIQQLLNFGFDENSPETALLRQVFCEMELEPTIKIFELFDERCIALLRYFRCEQAIAVSLLRLNHDAERLTLDADRLIEQFQIVNKIEFHKSQLSAVKSAVMNGVTVITGGPGTGKTTIIKCIAEIFSDHGLRVELCAPTGRAGKRISESCGKEAKTIHRMLGYEFKDGKMNFKYDQNNPLMCDVVIVDELSMVDVNVMLSLLRAIKSGTRLVLVGDKDQLPSVGAGNVLSDIIASKVIEIRYLSFIYRQSEGSLIVSNAHLVNQCKMPVIDNASQDFFVMNIDDMSVVAQTIVGLVAERLPKFTGVDSRDIQVLGALKSGVAGVFNLNVLLQQRLNPRTQFNKEITSGKNIFRQGDRVMQTVNDYNMEFTKVDSNGTTSEGQGIFNGDIGFVHHVDASNDILEVMFDDNRLCQYSRLDLQNLQLAYAVTIHKSQGSEFDVAVIPLVNGPPTIINKNLLYTAITRAKRLVVLVGSKKILGLMVRNNYIAKRTTLLNKFLSDEQLRFDRFFS